MGSPRRCSTRWLDADCPREVLAIIDTGPKALGERYDVLYTFVEHDGRDVWMTGFSLSEHGNGSHFELQAHQVAAYRYRMKHRYTQWSVLPEAVRKAVRNDLALMVLA